MSEGIEILLNPEAKYYEAHISWRLNNEESRPSKRSRTIILKISREVGDDYSALSDADKVILINRLGAYLKKKYACFVPEDKEEILPSSEVWEVDENRLGMLG